MAKAPPINLRYIKESTFIELKIKQSSMIAQKGFHVKQSEVIDQIIKEWKELKNSQNGN